MADDLTLLQLVSDTSYEEDLFINNVAPDITEDWTQAIQQATEADELAQVVIRRIKADDWRQLQPSERLFSSAAAAFHRQRHFTP